MADRLFSHELHQPESGEPCRVRISSVVGMAQTDGVTGIQLTDGRLLEVSETIDEVLTALGCSPDGHPLEAAQSGVLGEVAAERERQVRKGYDMEECLDGPLDDSRLRDDDLALAASTILIGQLPDGPESLALAIAAQVLRLYSDDPRRQLIIAAALLVAEVERMDRQAAEGDDR